MNEFLEQLSVIFNFSFWEIVGLSLFLLVFIVQMYFYFAYYRLPLMKAKKDGASTGNEEDNSTIGNYPKVSVIVEAENESRNLEELLPLLLTQDYPDYEVIIVNNGSVDESDILLDGFKAKYPNLYWTYLPHSQDRAFEFRKLALTLGVKAAKGDILLFTEAYCRPISDKWITSMVEPIQTEQKDIVLGYTCHKEKGSLFNRMVSFDTLIFGLQYFAATIKGKPFTGVFRNLAFKKHLFYDNKGFASHLHLDNCEEVFINQITTSENTTVCIAQNGFTRMLIRRRSLWRQMKKSYSIARSCFKGYVADLFSVELFSRYLFYGLFATLIVQSSMESNWGLLGVSIFFFVSRLLAQLIIINKSAKYFKSGEFYSSLPLLDLIQPLSNLRYKTRPQSIIR